MLDTFGTVSYNGYQFPGTYEVSVRMETIYSSDGFNPKMDMYEFTIKFIFTSEMTAASGMLANSVQSIDHSIAKLRALLMQSRKEFIYNYQGYGPNFRVTGANLDDPAIPNPYFSVMDVNGGPKPISFSFEPIGVNNAATVTWVVQIHLEPCSDVRELNNRINNPFSEYYYQRSFDFDSNGLLTLTTSGYIELRNAQSNIDLKRSLIWFKPIPSMIRETQVFDIQPDHKSANFRFVDRQVGGRNPYPKNCIKIEGTHTISSSLTRSGKLNGAGFLSWDSEFDVTITLPGTYRPVHAYHMFLFLLRQRIHLVDPVDGRETPPAPDPNDSNKDEKNQNQPTKPRSYLTRLRLTENLWSSTHNFSGSFFGLYSRDKFLEQSGWGNPIHVLTQLNNQSSEWANVSGKEPWDKSFDPNLQGMSLLDQWLQYYLASPPDFPTLFTNNLNVRETNLDTPLTIFNPCAVTSNGITRAPEPIYSPNDLNYFRKFNSDPSYTPNIPTKPIHEIAKDTDKESSYLDYDIQISVVESNTTYQMVKQCYSSYVEKVLKSGNTVSSELGKATTGFIINNNAAPEGTYEQDVKRASSYSSGSQYNVILSGHAVRVGYPTPIPSLLAYEGNNLYKGGEAIYTQKQIGISNKPVYMSAWSIPYLVDKDPIRDIFNKLIGSFETGKLM